MKRKLKVIPMCWKCCHGIFIPMRWSGIAPEELIACTARSGINDYDKACKMCPLLKQLDKSTK